MRSYLYHLLGLLFGVFCICSCQPNNAPVDENARPMSYSEKQLESFLDSVGRLPIEPMVKEARHYSDSIFYGRQNMAVKLSPSDYQALLQSAKTRMITVKIAQKYHWDYDTSEVFDGKIYINILPFDSNKDKPEKFAFYLGVDIGSAAWECDVYFLNRDLLIAKHHVNHRYGLEMDHYQDEEGKTVIYHKENFQSGSGIWWFDYYFYRYEGNTLIPVLKELQNGNLSMFTANRSRWLEAKVTDTRPLTLKMIYYLTGENGEDIIRDSTLVQYFKDAKSNMLKGNYAKSKLTEEQILAYNLGHYDDLFFTRAHFDILKKLANGKDKAKRKLVLYFLNEAKADLND